MLSFIVQARVGSSRLPNKILLPFYNGKSIFEMLLEKLKSFSDEVECVVATSADEKNDAIELICKENNVKCFRGSENDVLQRFIDAANYVGSDKIIRVCSDNPFLDVESIKLMIREIQLHGDEFDYISFNVNGTPSIKTHFGFWTEYVSLSTLDKVKEMTDLTLYHEHVTNFIYANPDIFKIKWLDVPSVLLNREHIRLTIDTATDFETAQSVYAELMERESCLTIEKIVEHLDAHGEYYLSMQDEIKRNSK